MQYLFDNLTSSGLKSHLCLRAWPEGLGIGVIDIPKEMP